MSQFTDLKGDTWEVSLTCRNVRLVKEAMDIDLGKYRLELGGLWQLPPLTLGTITGIILEKQLQERGVDAGEFEDRLNGTLIWEGVVPALADAVIDFFHLPRISTFLKADLRSLLETMATDPILNGTQSPPVENSPATAG